MGKNHTGNGNPPPKDDPIKKPERQPAPPVEDGKTNIEGTGII